MSKRVNPNRSKIHRSYTVEEIAELFDVHKRTVRNWIKSGLPVSDKARPLLILGTDLRLFLKQHRKKNKRNCKPTEAYCCRCREAREITSNSVSFIQCGEGVGRVFGRCSQCNLKINKFFSWRMLDALRAEFEVEKSDSAKTHNYEGLEARHLSLV